MSVGYHSGMQGQYSGSNYRTQEIMMAPPEKQVEKVYDVAIAGCMAREPQKIGKALATLMDSLNFDRGGDLATQLFSLYEYCLREVHQSQYEVPEKILRELRDTWKQAVATHRAA
ncbi:flagellar protein FliS [bacterium]|nr:flagellar protein FliS [bacterium]